MADTRGTWSLSEAWAETSAAEWVPLPNVWLQENDVGHFRDSVDTDGPLSRTNLDTELTAYAPGITNITRWSAGSSCYTHGLFAGGAATGSTSAPAISSTYKLTYSSYTSARAPSANLPVPKAISIGVASEDNAYINSGYEGGGSPAGQTGTCKISFATDTATNLPSANIAAINWEMQSLTDGAGGGYLFGGTWVPGQANTGSRCYKITYATDGLAQLPGSNTTWNTLETNRNPETSRASMMNRTAGYQSGGNSFPGSDGSSMTTKLTYSSMAWSVVPGAYLPNPRRKSVSGTGSRGKAWYGCGTQSGQQSNFTLLDFSAETWSAVPGMNHPGPSSSGQESANTSTSPRDSLKGADKASDLGYDSGKSERWIDGEASTPSANHAYFGMGFPSSGDGDFKKLDLDTETVGSATEMYTPGLHQFCVGSTHSTGYNLGGSYQGTAHSKVYKISYATNTGSTSPSNLNRTRRSSISNSNLTDAYVTRGYSSTSPDGTTSDVSRYTFATDTAGTFTPKFAVVDEKGQGCGNQDEGYQSYGGGTTITKITYATDTISTIPGQLSVPRSEFSSSVMASPTTGYFIGGSPGSGDAKSSIDKVTWSTGTVSAGSNLGPSGQSDPGAKRGQATSNGTVGYINFGAPAQPSAKDNKYTFATDTVEDKGNLFSHAPNTYSTAFSVRMNAQPSAQAPTATPTASTTTVPNPSVMVNGYWTAGDAGGTMHSITDKLTFATDTTARLPGSNRPSVVHFSGGASSTTKGYSFGGYEGWENPKTADVYSLTYASGSWANIPSALSESLGRTAAVNSITAGYSAGGGNADPYTYTSYVDKIVFASDTPSKNVTQTSANMQWGTGVGSATNGFFCNPKYDANMGTTIAEKLTYSTDSVAVSTTLFLSGSASGGNTRIAATMAMGKNDVAYVFGSKAPNRSTVNKITFATETSTMAPMLVSVKNGGAGLASDTVGYFSGASPGTTKDTFKMPFATDTWEYVGPADLTTSRERLTGFYAGMNGNAFPASPNVI